MGNRYPNPREHAFFTVTSEKDYGTLGIVGGAGTRWGGRGARQFYTIPIPNVLGFWADWSFTPKFIFCSRYFIFAGRPSLWCMQLFCPLRCQNIDSKWHPLWRHIKEDEQENKENNHEIHHDATTATPPAAPPLAGVLLSVLFNYLSTKRGHRQVNWVGTMTHSDKGTKRNDLGRFDGNNKQQQNI